MADVRFLKWSDESSVLNKVKDIVGPFGPMALLGHFRNIFAPGTYSCMDICAGVATIPKGIEINAFKEAVELGVYRPDGWAQFHLPPSHRDFRRIVEDEQIKEWSRINPNLKAKYDISLSLGPIDPTVDMINGLSAILSSEMDNGSIEVIVPALMHLSQSENWLLCDTEHRVDHGQWLPLNRRPQVILPDHDGGPPIKFTFCSSGLDPDADIIFLEGKNLRSVNKKVESVLRACRWL